MGNQLSPSLAVVPRIFFGGAETFDDNNKGDYATAKWVKSTGDVESKGGIWGTPSIRRFADFDSLITIIIDGSATDFRLSGHRCVATDITMTGTTFNLAGGDPIPNSPTVAQYSQHNKVIDSNIAATSPDVAGLWWFALYDSLVRCRISYTATYTSGPIEDVLKLQNCKNFYVRDCLIELTNKQQHGSL